jgi:hypothetical protein
MKKIFLKSLTPAVGLAAIALAVSSPVWADCYRDCMDMHGCGSSLDSSYCSGVQGRCASECRDKGPEGRAKSYGAIAYSRKNGAYGYSHGWASQKKAEAVALKNCKENGSGCKSEVWFYNGCGAVASNGQKVSWGQGSTRTAAMQQALKKCNSGFFQKKCEGKVSACSG